MNDLAEIEEYERQVMALVAVGDKELARLDNVEASLMPAIDRLVAVLEEKKKIVESQIAVLEHLRSLHVSMLERHKASEP